MGVKPWENFKTQSEWRQYLQDLVRTNDKALLRAIWVIYQRQTDEEQKTGVTTEENGMGFGKVDAEFFTNLVVKMRHGQKLTTGEMAAAHNKMPKYWRQLMVVSKTKMKAMESESEEEKE